jgi:predicted anti-sigma-YlaC factor YlaD
MNAEPLRASCARVRARLDLALDGALAPLEAALDAGHLEACADCAAAARSRAQWLDRVREAIAPDPALHARLGAQVLARLASEAPPRRLSSRRRGASPAQAAALAAAALVLLSLLPWISGGVAALAQAGGPAVGELLGEALPSVEWRADPLSLWSAR